LENTVINQNEVRLIHGGAAYFDLLIRLINGARDNIHLQTYIFDDDETGLRVAAALKAAARRGVTVHVLTDGYASQVLAQDVIDDLRKAGIYFRFFEPLFKTRNFYFGRRLHHKIFVADSEFALVGGVNITNRYNDFPGKQAWLDFAVLSYGSVAKELCILCWKTWNNFHSKMEDATCNPIGGPFEFKVEPCPVWVRRNDWVRKKNEISGSYIRMFRNARSDITIICSYFLPGKFFRRLLHYTSKRGVTIKVITTSTSDVPLAKNAERWFYDWLLRNQIRIYEYQPSILHAKAAVCDAEWATIGSYNINNLSAYASIELNLDIIDAGFANNFSNELETIIARDCILITKDLHKRNRNVFKQLYRWFSYQFIRVVFYMMTFYYKQKK
jgi:cardiolipin synthase